MVFRKEMLGIHKDKSLWIIYVVFFFACFQSSVLGQEVVLIRHAEVDMVADGWMGTKKAAGYRAQYDIAPIKAFDSEEVLGRLPELRSDTIYTSALFRSKETAHRLLGDSHVLVSLSMLNEYQLHVVRWPLVLPYKGWTTVSRLMWLLGAKKENVESYKQAKIRTQRVVDFIEERAIRNQQVVLVTHGFLNFKIAKELEKRGWGRIKNNGKKNLGATVFQK